MFKKILAILIILLIAGFVFAKVKFKKVASSDFDFPTEQTANLAQLVKTRSADAGPPNVIILLADDLGWADVGYRGSDIQTPNICLLYTSPSPRDQRGSRMPSSA